MLQPLAIVSVINDLVSDQRVHRTSLTLKNAGYDVLLVGRKKKNSPSLLPREYETRRMVLLFEKGPFFYAEFNLRLFFFLLTHKAALLISNDLDTLLPNYIINKIRRTTLVFDAHEYFTGVPELVKRPWVRKCWKKIERMIMPSIKYMVTVNDSIAALYEKEYAIVPLVIRNIPLTRKPETGYTPTRFDLELADDKKIILLQGAGININRGAEEAVLAMQYTEGAIFLIIGDGDVIPALKSMVLDLNLVDKVRFLPLQPLENLATYTSMADIGITFDKDTNINYRYSLPNKLFDYIQAGLPILASPLPEVKRIIEEYGCGVFIENYNPQHIAACFTAMLKNEEFLRECSANAFKAAATLNGETEQLLLLNLFNKIRNCNLMIKE
jgi:glycosyltransferase involved in cell wall biosynthesis